MWAKRTSARAASARRAAVVPRTATMPRCAKTAWRAPSAVRRGRRASRRPGWAWRIAVPDCRRASWAVGAEAWAQDGRTTAARAAVNRIERRRMPLQRRKRRELAGHVRHAGPGGLGGQLDRLAAALGLGV